MSTTSGQLGQGLYAEHRRPGAGTRSDSCSSNGSLSFRRQDPRCRLRHGFMTRHLRGEVVGLDQSASC